MCAQAQPAPVKYCEAHLSSPCAMFSYVRAHASREVALQAFQASVWRRAPLPFLRHWPSSSTCMQQSSNCKCCMPQLSSDSIAPDLAPSIMKALTLHLLHLRGRHCQLPHNYSDEGPNAGWPRPGRSALSFQQVSMTLYIGLLHGISRHSGARIGMTDGRVRVSDGAWRINALGCRASTASSSTAEITTATRNTRSIT